QSTGMAVPFGSQGLVFCPAGRVMLNGVVGPIMDGVSQTPIAGSPTRNQATLAASFCYRGGTTQCPQTLSFLASNRPDNLFAQPIELLLGVDELAVDEPQAIAKARRFP